MSIISLAEVISHMIISANAPGLPPGECNKVILPFDVLRGSFSSNQITSSQIVYFSTVTLFISIVRQHSVRDATLYAHCCLPTVLFNFVTRK